MEESRNLIIRVNGKSGAIMQSVMESVFAHIEETEDRVFEIAYSLVHWIDKTYMNVDTEVPIETEMGNHF
jgi:hypothetical protein